MKTRAQGKSKQTLMMRAFQKSKGISEDGNKIDKLKNGPDHLFDITRQDMFHLNSLLDIIVCVIHRN